MINFTTIFNKSTLTIALLLLTIYSFSQKNDSLNLNVIKEKVQVNGAITITNNGISVVPTFTLGKPATIFDLIIRKNRFSFEPQFRFAIEDFKPWSFIFWMRYKFTDTQKFKMGIGVHPSTVFQNTIISTNGISKDAITVRRYWAGDLNPTYYISKNFSIGVYYLYSRGLADATKNTNFVALSSNLSNIKLWGDFLMKVSPQIYYLRLDDNVGYYATSTFTLAKKNFPLAISSIINKKIQSEIPSDDIVWNVSLVYLY
jgi:hypothetical protein